MSETITLLEPIEVGQNILTELTIRKPSTGDIRGLKIRVTTDGDTVGLDLMTDDILILLGRCTEQLPAVINKLSIPDSMAAGKILINFMRSSPKTGSNG